MISILIKAKTNSRYLIGYLGKCIRPLVWIIPKIIGYVKTFIAEDKNNKLKPFPLSDEKQLQKI